MLAGPIGRLQLRCASFRQTNSHVLMNQMTVRPLVTLMLSCVALGFTWMPGECTAAGRWNMPSTTAQWMGCGFGAGYHAPRVLGPSWKGTTASPGVRRSRYPLATTACGAAPYAAHPVAPCGTSQMVHHQPHATDAQPAPAIQPIWRPEPTRQARPAVQTPPAAGPLFAPPAVPLAPSGELPAPRP